MCEFELLSSVYDEETADALDGDAVEDEGCLVLQAPPQEVTIDRDICRRPVGSVCEHPVGTADRFWMVIRPKSLCLSSGFGAVEGADRGLELASRRTLLGALVAKGSFRSDGLFLSGSPALAKRGRSSWQEQVCHNQEVAGARRQ